MILPGHPSVTNHKQRSGEKVPGCAGMSAHHAIRFNAVFEHRILVVRWIVVRDRLASVASAIGLIVIVSPGGFANGGDFARNPFRENAYGRIDH